MARAPRSPRSALGRFAWRAFLALVLLPPVALVAMQIWVTRSTLPSDADQALYILGMSAIGALWFVGAPLAGLLALLTRGRRIPPPA